ncbi:hypothetical protein GCM10009758_11560 [Microbacterium hatanonis]
MGGCSVTPEPQETAPAFATEEEAFAAAEQTYRAYVDALNQVDLSDPETFEPVFALTTGEANASARQTLSERHANGWVVTGSSQITVAEPLPSSSDTENVVLAVCLDVSEVALTDSTGLSVVSPDRPDTQTMAVTVTRADDSHKWLIEQFAGRDSGPECAS